AAAESLFNLNRYAKWPSCKNENREEIYSLKTELIRLLHHLGLATAVKLHEVERPGQTCHRCNGTGQADGYDDEDYGDDDGGCSRCGGSGWWREPDKLVYVVFRFL